MSEPKTMTINEVEYVRKDSMKENVKDKDGLRLCLVRTYSAGVFLAWVDYVNCEFFNCKLTDSIRIWKWAGAFSLSELAMDGTTAPNDCKFATAVIPEQKVNRVIEMIPVTGEANETFKKAKRG